MKVKMALDQLLTTTLTVALAVENQLPKQFLGKKEGPRYPQMLIHFMQHESMVKKKLLLLYQLGQYCSSSACVMQRHAENNF